MFFIFRGTIFFLVLVFSSLSYAQQNIAVIDIETAAIRSDYAKSEIEKLKQSDTFKKNLDEYNALGKEFQALQKEGQANGLTWSDEQKQAHKKKMEEKVVLLNKIGGQLDAEKAAVDKRIQQELTPRIEKIVPEIIKNKKIDLLLKSQAAYFVIPEYNITQDLIDRLNKPD
jgi:outer membrane protein